MKKILLALGMLLFANANAAPITVDFENYTDAVTNPDGSIELDGLRFFVTNQSGPISFFISPSVSVNEGTAGLIACPRCTINIESVSGSPFSLASIDVSGPGVTQYARLRVSGIGPGGGTEGADHFPWGLYFEEFEFDPIWTELSSVRVSLSPDDVNQIYPSILVIDNLVVDIVPIPAAAWLFFSALGLLGLRRVSHGRKLSGQNGAIPTV